MANFTKMAESMKAVSDGIAAASVTAKEAGDAMRDFSKEMALMRDTVGPELHKAIASGNVNFHYKDDEPQISTLSTRRDGDYWLVDIVVIAYSGASQEAFSHQVVADMMSRYLNMDINERMVEDSIIDYSFRHLPQLKATIRIPIYQPICIPASLNCRCALPEPIVIPPNTDIMMVEPSGLKDGKPIMVTEDQYQNIKAAVERGMRGIKSAPEIADSIRETVELIHDPEIADMLQMDEPEVPAEIPWDIPDVTVDDFDPDKRKPIRVLKNVVWEDSAWHSPRAVSETTKPKTKRRWFGVICWWTLSAAATTGLGYLFKWLIANWELL